MQGRSWSALKRAILDNRDAGIAAPASKTWRLLPWIMLAAFAVRAIVALLTDTFAHPDEAYQYLEQGHRLAFGYGWKPWEYVHGIRSWIIPGAIAVVLKPFAILGLDSPYIYQPVVELLLCAISLILPLSMYRITQALFSEGAARLALIFGCFWYQIVSFAHRPLADALSVYTLFAALALILRPPTMRSQVLVGALTALTMLLRFQQLPLLGVIGIVGLIRWREKVWWPALSFLVVLVLGGALDAYTWGVWFSSIVVNIEFNLVQDVSSEFGVSPLWFYFLAVVLASLGGCLLGAAGLALSWRRSWPLIAIAVVALLFFSMIAHKEPRFIFAVVPIWLIGMAVLVKDARLEKPFALVRSRWVSPAVVAVIAFVSLAAVTLQLPGQWWLGNGMPIAGSDARQAYRYLSAQPDVSGVIDDVNDMPFGVAGYYDLHADVPLYFIEYWSHGGDEARSNPVRYVSHMLKFAEESGAPGFSRLTQFGRVVIWKRDRNPPENAIPASYDRLIWTKFNKLPTKVTPRW